MHGRLLKKLARQAVPHAKYSKGVWMKNMCFVDFHWSTMKVEAIRRMSDCEVVEKLENAAWRKVSEMIFKDMEEKPKLCMLKEIVDLWVELSCAMVRKKRERMMLYSKAERRNSALSD